MVMTLKELNWNMTTNDSHRNTCSNTKTYTYEHWGYKIATVKSIKLIITSLPLPSHGGLPPYDWRGVWYKDNRGERPEDKAADLGHSGTGALQGRHPLLLPRSCRGAHGLRHHQVQDACYLSMNAGDYCCHVTTWSQLHTTAFIWCVR